MTAHLVLVDAARHRLTHLRRQLSVTRRLVHLLPIVASSVAGGLLVWRMGAAGDIGDVVMAASVAVGISPTFADRAAVTLAASPTSRAWRAATRLVIVVPVAVASWVIVRSLALHHIPGMESVSGLAGWVPGRDATLVLATLVVGALVIEISSDRGGTTPGVIGSISALMGAAVLLHLPRAVAVTPVESHRWRWVGLLALALALLSVALADRGRAKLLRRRRADGLGGHATAGRDPR